MSEKRQKTQTTGLMTRRLFERSVRKATAACVVLVASPSVSYSVFKHVLFFGIVFGATFGGKPKT